MIHRIPGRVYLTYWACLTRRETKHYSFVTDRGIRKYLKLCQKHFETLISKATVGLGLWPHGPSPLSGRPGGGPAPLPPVPPAGSSAGGPAPPPDPLPPPGPMPLSPAPPPPGRGGRGCCRCWNNVAESTWNKISTRRRLPDRFSSDFLKENSLQALTYAGWCRKPMSEMASVGLRAARHRWASSFMASGFAARMDRTAGKVLR